MKLRLASIVTLMKFLSMTNKSGCLVNAGELNVSVGFRKRGFPIRGADENLLVRAPGFEPES